MKKLIPLFFAVVLCASAVSAQKIEVKDIVAKHMASVMSPQQKTKITNLTAVGETSFVQGSNHQRGYAGKSVLVSDGKKTALAVAFPIQDYPFERVIYDGRKLSLPFIRPGARSPLGNYLFANDEVVKDGLFGGVLSTNWLFNFPDEKRGSMSSQGTKKLDGKEVHVISYTTKGGSGLGIKLYFDAETGRHVRTEYRRTSSGAMVAGSPEASAGATTENIETLIEDFSDFKTEGGVTLPTTYKIRISQVIRGNNREFTYTMKVGTFYYNQQLDASTFVPEANS